jgi:hypothetical protein
LIHEQEKLTDIKRAQKVMRKGRKGINFMEDGRMGDFLDIDKSVNPKLMD